VRPWPPEGTPEAGAETIVNFTTTLNSWLFRAGDKIEYRVYVEVRTGIVHRYTFGAGDTGASSSSLQHLRPRSSVEARSLLPPFTRGRDSL